MLHCPRCKSGDLVASTKEVTYSVAGRDWIVEEPATECEACEEVYVSGEAVRRSELALASRLAESGHVHGEALRFMRKALGLSGVRLAELLGVSPETVSRWERGHTPVEPLAFAVVGAIVADRVNGRETTANLLRAQHEPEPAPAELRVTLR